MQENKETSGERQNGMTKQESKTGSKKTAIRCEDVNLTFRLLDKQDSLKGFFVNRAERAKLKTIHAVNNVSFELGHSEILGIVGNNGAGKSSLLRLLARIYRPDSGLVEVNGRISALLELGAGFHPELSGRENVFLNAKILGIPKETIEERYDSIVKWAGLEDFMDMEIHCFSSGMRARLGFAVAMEMEPDVLLVDEVLSVGDAEFRRRCNEKFSDFVAAKATIVLVTHQLSLVEERCTKAMWLDHGEARAFGEPDEVLGEYSQFLWEAEQAAKEGEEGGAAVSVKASRAYPRTAWMSVGRFDAEPNSKPKSRARPLTAIAPAGRPDADSDVPAHPASSKLPPRCTNARTARRSAALYATVPLPQTATMS